MPSKSRQPTVLLADDHVIVRRALCDFLMTNGINVVAMAATAERTLELIQKFHPDIVITDVNMPPDLGGLELARQLKANGCGGPVNVIVMSVDQEELNLVDFPVEGLLLKIEAGEKLVPMILAIDCKNGIPKDECDTVADAAPTLCRESD